MSEPSAAPRSVDSVATTGRRSRGDHRRTILADLDALHGMLVATLAAIGSGGLLYLAYLVRGWRIARGAVSVAPGDEGWAGAENTSGPVRVLLFGKHCADGMPDADFAQRIARVAALVDELPDLRVMLLGGGPPPTEAEIAHRALLASGVPATTPFEFEQESRDTLQNLRHARQLIGAEARPVVLVSNRYHLPRCALFARHLGIDHVLCAAEAQWRPSPSNLAKLALESAYCMWVDVGRRWAQLIGHRRMLGKVS
ncbi:MAG: YdcF family protein [Xanthomonadales bacterium]|nr:YdcF family protein [Xanthomonadales bacterium]